MIIYSDRLEFSELQFNDIHNLSVIAQRMAWNDTINVLLRSFSDEKFDKVLEQEKPDLYFYKTYFKIAVQKQFGKDIKDFNDDEKKILFEKIPMSLIPEQSWHINFSLLKPNFKESSINFVQQAINKKNAPERNGYWLAIRDKNTHELMGATIISSRELNKDNKKIIGHSGQFIDPKFQKKGYISEAKAVMVDFLYKYSDMTQKGINPDAFFYTTCHKYNVGSQALQNKSGAHTNGEIDANGKLHYFASRDEIYASRLMQNYTKGWFLIDDQNKCYFSSFAQPLTFTNQQELDIHKDLSSHEKLSLLNISKDDTTRR